MESVQAIHPFSWAPVMVAILDLGLPIMLVPFME